MFKKLKEKITEEVKISPQRFQQLTQSVSDKLQGTSSNDENFFSIGEEDANTSSASTTDQGFSSVTLVSPSAEDKMRRNSTSSIASDVSFLPRYEVGNLYHLQSDLDVSASEIEDNTSQSSSTLGRLSKEQLYSAFKKSQVQYHKYRGRYTDLARHYKELEREVTKMKSVLVETQDKAIRRVTELKEQCSLEQKAKAHLEGALRDELDEKQMKIQSLQTKIGLLQQGQNSSEPLSDFDKKETNHVSSEKLEQLTKYLNDARSEIESLNGKIQEYKAGNIVFQSKELEYKTKIIQLEKDISDFSEREKENNIKLAENKMELHNELLSKDAEISRLKQDIDTLKTSLSAQEKEGRSTKMENLQSQNNKLIDKLENLTQKCNGLENELLKMEKYKMEIKELNDMNSALNEKLQQHKELKDKVGHLTNENNQLENVIDGLKIGLNDLQGNFKRLTEEKDNLIETIKKEKHEYESQIESLRDSAKKGLFTLEKQILERVKTSYESREALLKQEFAQKVEEISTNNKSTKEIQLLLVDRDNEIKVLSDELQGLKQQLIQKENHYRELENNHLELIEEGSQLRSKVASLEKQVVDISDESHRDHEDKVLRLQANIKTLQGEIDQILKRSDEKEKNNVQLCKEMLDLQNSNAELLQKVRLIEGKQDALELETTESDLLEMKVQALEQEKISLLESFEQERKVLNDMIRENKELKIKDEQIGEWENRNQTLEEKVLRLKSYLKQKEENIVELQKLKLHLEQEVDKLKEFVRIKEEQEEAIELDKTECNLLQIKVQQLENEKDNLVKSFEMERETFDHVFHKHNKEFDLHKEEIMNENVSLAKENLELKDVNQELAQKVRIFEEKEQVIELNTSEWNLQKLKLQEMEKEKQELLQSFEMERMMFNKILEEHKDLKLKEEQMKNLDDSNKHLTEKLAEFKGYLTKKDADIVELHKAKLALEEHIAKLTESLRIKEEEIDSILIEQTECGLLEMKVKALEEEKQELLNSFEIERETFEETCTKLSHFESKIEELNEENVLLTKENEVFTRTIQTKLEEITRENMMLKEEKEQINDRVEEENKQNKQHIEKLSEQQQVIEELREEINKHDHSFKNLTKMLDNAQCNRQEAVDKLEDVEQQLVQKNAQINDLKKSLEKLYNESEEKQLNEEEKSKELDHLQKEKIRLEIDIKKKIDDYSFKAKEMAVIQHQLSVLTQDKDNLVIENKKLKDEIEDVTQECANLQSLMVKVKELEQVKMQNEIVQNKYDKLNQETSELKVRVNQLSSDNRNINDEHEKVLMELEEYKVKNEFLENEKINLEKIRQSVEASVDGAEISQGTTSVGETCDNLSVENKNLKQECSKLEEQCDHLSKIKKDLENQLVELERHYNELLHEKQLLQDEVHELKIAPINTNTYSNLDNLATIKQEILLGATPNGPSTDTEKLQREIDNLREKLTQYKSLDITNKSSIEFYEHELQKMKNKHEKLNRKLDETLVTLNHCTELSSSTEIEYLRNVLYNYMLGKESLVLARVIAAVCKFDQNQTDAVLQKEQQKQTLLGQLGLL